MTEVAAGLNPYSLDCPVCPAKAGERCLPMESWSRQRAERTYLEQPHPERVEWVSNHAALADPGDAQPITEAEILATGEV